jgi:hypothetical protein
MPRSNVKQTFLNKLFDRPRPIGVEAFNVAVPLLFPGRSDYVRFLKAEREEEQKDLAKQIIYSLVHSRPFSPPSHLLANLLNFEETSGGEGKPTSTGYLAQDHFVHLVNLYLTGIYLFSYHQGIHHQCQNYLTKLRRDYARDVAEESREASLLIRAKNEYELFSEVWVYIVLYHDLGYPLEAISPEQRTDPTWGRFVEPFQNILGSVFKDYAIKALSNLIALDLILSEDHRIEFVSYLGDAEHLYYINSSGSADDQSGTEFKQLWGNKSQRELTNDDIQTITKEFGQAILYGRLHGAFALKLVGTVLPDADSLAVLVKSATGEPAALVLRSNSGSLVLSVRPLKSLSARMRRLSASQWAEYAFQRGISPQREYQWEYFARSVPSLINRVLDEILPKNKDAYSHVKDHILGLLPFSARFAPMTTDAFDIARLAFWEIHHLLGYVGEADTQSDLTVAFESVTKSFLRVADEFHERIGASLSTVIKKQVEGEQIDPFDLLANHSLTEVEAEIVRIVSSSAGAVAANFRARIAPAVEEARRHYQGTRTCQRAFRKVLSNALGDLSEDDINPFVELPKTGKDTLPPAALGKLQDEFSDIDELLSRSGLYGFSDLLMSYVPPFAQSGENDPASAYYFDHGLASALAGAVARRAHRLAHQELCRHSGPVVAPAIRLLRLAFVVTSQAEDKAVGVGLDVFMREALGVVILHNLYPQALKPQHRTFKTSLREHPLTFISLIADGIQVWDRRKLLNQARGDLPFSLAARDIDLQVDNGDIVLGVGNKHDLGIILGRYKEGMETYIRGARSLIKISAAG